MCYAVFIAVSTSQQTNVFVPDVTTLYLEEPDIEKLNALSDKFTLPYIYYVGSDTQCSCGFEFHSELFNDPEWQDSKASPQALLDLLDQLTVNHFVEVYCCWDGDWYEPVEHRRILNCRGITLEKNYFALIERELITFTNTEVDNTLV
jgi:hypothetical protein